MTGRPGRRDTLLLIVAAAVAGPIFFLSLGRLWPLPALDLDPPAGAVLAGARTVLERVGAEPGDAVGSVRLQVDAAALDHARASLGGDAMRRVEGGLPVVRWVATLKTRGRTTVWRVDRHPAGAVVGWRESVEDDAPGASLPLEAARDLAHEIVADVTGIDLAGLDERAASSERRVARVDHRFVYERELDMPASRSDAPPLRERLSVGVAGDRVVAFDRSLVVPPAVRRETRAAEAPGRALEALGFGLVGLGAAFAFVVFLRRLGEGAVDLRRAAFWPLVVFGCLVATYALDGAQAFAAWEPLWPRWVSNLRFIVFRALFDSWIPLVLLAVVGAGFAVDDRSGARRGASLAALARGRLLDPGVVTASWRGFLVGLVCGGVLATAVSALLLFAGAEVQIQPRGFFFYPLDSTAPALTTLLFFLGVALAEELGYRFFGAGILLERRAGRVLAVVLPALVYGLSHTRLDFLPPADPFWARPLALTLVGCVWGAAFLRYDALTVVLSHYTADLFIFNWPRFASGSPTERATSVAAVLVPLAPALLALATRPFRRPRGGPV